MSACCDHSEKRFDGASREFRCVLWIVIAINGFMFAVEMTAGGISGSQALQADALDFAADTATYALSLAVIGLSLKTRSTAALIKGLSLLAMGLWVLASTIWHVFNGGLPRAEIMGPIGFLALTANLASVILLLRYREGDANVRSVWLCSRNDAIGNVAVMLAALGVFGSGSAWPDLAVAALMSGLFLYSAMRIISQAVKERQEAAKSHRHGAATVSHAGSVASTTALVGRLGEGSPKQLNRAQSEP